MFHRWVSSGYKGTPDDHVTAYVLYDGCNLNDDGVLSASKAAAGAGNVALLLGALCAHMTGWEEASVDGNPLYGSSQVTFGSLVMGRVCIVKFSQETY